MKYIKWLLGILLLLILLVILYVRVAVHEERPSVVSSENPEALANHMLEAINKAAWDTLPYVAWSFRGEHDYVWDKVNNNALVSWGDYEVHLDPDEVTGKAFEKGQLVEGEEGNKLISKAWSYWCNDMFWLAAPFKIKDKGTSLSIAKDDEGKTGLLVEYKSGGVTPGDAYLWYLNENGMPTGYKMWVKIIPIGGVYTTWEEWETLKGGAKVASMHQGNISALKIPITNLKSGDSWGDLGYTKSPINL